MSHYLTTIPEGCTCHYTEQRDPAEPHMPAFFDAEPNPNCRVHFTDLDRAQRQIDVLLMLLIQGCVTGSDGEEHTLFGADDGDGWDEPLSEAYSCSCAAWEVTWVQIDPACSDRPAPTDIVRQWMAHVWPVATGEEG